VFSQGVSSDVNLNKISPPDRASDEVQIRVVVVNPLIFKKKQKKISDAPVADRVQERGTGDVIKKYMKNYVKT